MNGLTSMCQGQGVVREWFDLYVSGSGSGS